MNILITATAFTALFCGAAFAQSSDIAHEAHRFVNNASAVSHVNSSTHENLPDRVNKNNTPSFSEMNEHERAIVAHSFMGNDSNLLIVFYVQIMPDDFVMQLHRF